MKKLIEGILEKIDSVEVEYKTVKTNGNHPRVSLNRILTSLRIKNSKESRIIHFDGIIFPDSIGNKIVVYQADDYCLSSGYIIEDLKLKRKYSGETPVL